MTQNMAKRIYLAAAVHLIFIAALPAADSPRSLVSKGNSAYEDGQYPQALGAYEAAGEQKPDAAQIWFNKGDALYQQGRFTDAMDAYEQAAVRSKDRGLEALSKYNQGNAAFREGAGQAQTNPGQALEGIQKSVHLYQDALQADPSLGDARHNIEVARHVIQRLKELMEKQPQQNDQNKDQDKQKQDQNQQQQQQAGNQDQKQKQDPQQQQQDEQNQDQQKDQKQQQAQNQQQQAGEKEKPQPQPARAAKDILNKERDDKRMRQLQAVVGIQPVDKDW